MLAKAGVPIAFGTEGIEKLETASAKLRTLLGEGLTPDQALDALTRSAARMAGLENRLGTLEPGKLAHVVAFTAPLKSVTLPSGTSSPQVLTWRRTPNSWNSGAASAACLRYASLFAAGTARTKPST